MRFLAIIFLSLFILSCGWIGTGLVLTAALPGAVQDAAKHNTSLQRSSANEQTVVNGLTVLTGGGLTLGFFLCTGIPAGLMSLILGLVFYSGYQTERRHRETMDVAYMHNSIIGTMSATQIAQAQMQFNQITAQNPPPRQVQSPYNDEWDRDEQNPNPPKYVQRGEIIVTPKRTRRPGETNVPGQSTDDAIDKIRRRNRMD